MSQATGLLSKVQVIELAQRISGPYCGKILAHLGASVIKVEPPEGDAARWLGPFPDHTPHPEKSGLFLWLNANKYGVTLDLTAAAGRRQLQQLVRTADIIIANDAEAQLDEWGLGYESLRSLNPGLVFTSITPFGNWGPYAAYKTSDLVLFHMSGNAHGLLGPVEEPEHRSTDTCRGASGRTGRRHGSGNGNALGPVPQAYDRYGVPCAHLSL